MPFSNGPGRSVLSFMTSAEMPHLIYKARQITGHTSNTDYIRKAVCEALARDLGTPVERFTMNLPPSRPKTHGGVKQAGFDEEVR
jgi:hypothetical protein